MTETSILSEKQERLNFMHLCLITQVTNMFLFIYLLYITEQKAVVNYLTSLLDRIKQIPKQFPKSEVKTSQSPPGGGLH